MLRYMGGGFMVGIPARDMNEQEAARYGGVDMLVATRLWALDMSATLPILPIEQAAVPAVVELAADLSLEGNAYKRVR